MTTRKGTVSATRDAAVTIGQDSAHAWETAGGPEAGSRRRRGVTLVLLGSIVVSFLAASAAPTPMYALYAKQWGFSALALVGLLVRRPAKMAPVPAGCESPR